MMYKEVVILLLILRLLRVAIIYAHNRKVDAEVAPADFFWYYISLPFTLPVAEVLAGQNGYTRYKILKAVQLVSDVIELAFLVYTYWQLSHCAGQL